MRPVRGFAYSEDKAITDAQRRNARPLVRHLEDKRFRREVEGDEITGWRAVIPGIAERLAEPLSDVSLVLLRRIEQLDLKRERIRSIETRHDIDLARR